MSDPVKSSDIEDVLSSIRRLVSEESRTGPGANDAAIKDETQAAGPEERTEPPARDALVLTPALRIHDGGKDVAASPDRKDSDHIEDASVVAQDAVLEAVAETIVADALEQEITDQDGTDTGEPAAVDDAGIRDALEEGETLAGAEEGITDDTPMPDASDAAMTGNPPEVEALSVAEPDTTEPENAMLENAMPENAMPEDTVAEDTVPEDAVPAHPDPEDPEKSGESLEAKIAALEVLIGKRNEDWEPEEGDASVAEHGSTFDGSAEALDWEDHEPAESSTGVAQAEPVSDDFETPTPEDPDPARSGAPAVEETTDATPEDARLDDVEPQYIDEDALRDMVSEIVREELQGALGERITRNVRRLVRREIHRALASQELD